MTMIKLTLTSGGYVWLNTDAISHISHFEFENAQRKLVLCTGVNMSSGLVVPVVETFEEVLRGIPDEKA